MTKIIESKGVDPRVSSVEGQFANHYAMKPSVTVIVFKFTLVYASLLRRIH